jgi:hypothetical protein
VEGLSDVNLLPILGQGNDALFHREKERHQGGVCKYSETTFREKATSLLKKWQEKKGMDTQGQG